MFAEAAERRSTLERIGAEAGQVAVENSGIREL